MQEWQEWQEKVLSSGTVELLPQARTLLSLGRNHSLQSAIADLVDNSIDAGANHVRVRFVRNHGQLRSLCVIDNGQGITSDLIDQSMTVGGTRRYDDADLGHFGVGLKAASFSQAESLTVISKAPDDIPVGRRWATAEAKASFSCDVVDSTFSDREFSRDWGVIREESGTIVRWDDVHTFPATTDSDRIEEYLSQAISTLVDHLGLIFHRIIEKTALRIDFDVIDVMRGVVGSAIGVPPVNPFNYSRSGDPSFPKALRAQGDNGELTLLCHIWPGRSTLREFKLPGGAIGRQGLYFYRRDRLLQAGGWDGIRNPDRRLQLARVEVDIDGDSDGLYRMNPEKSRVHITSEFARLAESAKAPDGASLSDYLEAAEGAFRNSRKRSQKRISMLPPGRGFSRPLRRVISDEVPLLAGEDGVDIRWKSMGGDDTFFQVDHAGKTLWLNSRYRSAVLGGRNGSLNDAPIIKALLFLLMENVFNGEYLGWRDRDNIDLWSEILTIAAQDEVR